MKKIFAITLTLFVMLGSFGALAQESTTLGGVVLEATQSTILIETEEFGQVLVNYDETTKLEGIEDGIAVGSYIIVTYSGAMTRSIPGQINAELIAMYKISGTVVEVSDAGVLVDQGGEAGLVLVHLADGMRPLFFGCPVDVYSNGVMTASYPGQISALYVVTPTLNGTITELSDGYFLMTDAEGTEYRVNNDDSTTVDAKMNVGDVVSVYIDGKLTCSIPAQAYGIAVFHTAE